MTRTMPPTRNRFQRPGRGDDPAGARCVETSRPPTIAIDIRPAWVGVMPRAIWKYWLEVDGRRRTSRRRPAPRRAVARLVVRSRNRRSGMIGSPGDPPSTKIAATRTSDAEPDQPDAGDRDPVELVAGQRHPDQQRRDAADDQGGAEVVDVHLAPDAPAGAASSAARRRRARRPGCRRRSTSASRGGVSTIRPPMSGPLTVARRERRADVAGVAAALARGDHRWR